MTKLLTLGFDMTPYDPTDDAPGRPAFGEFGVFK
jgi:hypothetical protein